ncbi:MAG: hydrolase [Anaerolinea sp.]|nr:hydrolase [Anaerolinea sp.]
MLITNGKLITWGETNRILEGWGLLVRGDRIVEMAPSSELEDKYPCEEQLDAKRQYIMPGNICAHTHFYGAYARGMAIPGAAAKDFPEILQKLWWPLDKSLAVEDVYNSTQICLLDAIKHGTTTLIDHHASPNAIEGSLDQIAKAAVEMGVRVSCCYEVTDRDGMELSHRGIGENIRFIKQLKQEPNDLLAASFGIHSSLTVSDETLEACRKAAGDETGFHIHVAEHEVDEYDSLAKSGTRVVDRLEKFGILGTKSIVVHAVHIDAKEVEILARTKTWVTHQPRSNMNNGVGLGNVESFIRAGVSVCVGNDGFSNAMWDEWKTAYLAHKLWNRDPRRMGGYEVVKMAITNNANLANIFFPKAPIGVLKEGAYADLMFVDYHPYTEMTAGNLPWHIIFGFSNRDVTATIAAGKVLMKDRVVLVADEATIAAKGCELSRKTWERYHKRFN